MLKIVVVLGLILGIAHGSLFCPHTAEPSGKDNFRSMIIESKSREGQEPMYRIVDSDNKDQSYTAISEEFRLLTRMDNSECPGRSCVTELSAAMPRHQGSVLYLTNIVGKLIPPGFTPVEVKNRLYCTIVEGDCGATVPIYRYYKFTTAGLFHAYSTEGLDVDGFTRETMPLCWAWPVDKPETAEAAGVKTVSENDPTIVEEENKTPKMIRLDCSSKSKKPMRSAMKSLNVWKNNRQGTFMDHYYTTKHPGKGYEYDDTVGLVVVDEEKSKCNCLIRLTQMVDNKPDGIWARLDHKLISDYKEPPPNAGEEYTSMDEEVYCAKEEGACGATIPLRKFFKLGDLDTIYTVNDDKTPLFSIPSPSGVLCYIWPTGTADLPEEALKKAHKADKKEEEKKETTTGAPKKDETTPAKEEKTPNEDSKKEKPAKESTKKKDEKKSEAKKAEKPTTAAPASTTVTSTTVEVTQPTTAKKEEPSTTVEVTSTTPSTTTETTTEATTEATTTSEAPSSSVEPTVEMKEEKVETTTEASTTLTSEAKIEETTAEASTTLTSEAKIEETTVSTSTVEPEKPIDEARTSESPKEEEKEQPTTTSAPESSTPAASTELPKETSPVSEATTAVEETTVAKQ